MATVDIDDIVVPKAASMAVTYVQEIDVNDYAKTTYVGRIFSQDSYGRTWKNVPSSLNAGNSKAMMILPFGVSGGIQIIWNHITMCWRYFQNSSIGGWQQFAMTT